MSVLLRRLTSPLVALLAVIAVTVPATAAVAAPAPLPHVVGGYIPSGGRILAGADQAGVYASTTLPASVDLRQYAPPVGDQGQVGSCVAWTIAHGIMGYYATRTGGVGAPYAPLFLYMRTVAPGGAPSAGLNPDQALANAQSGGVDTQDNYFQGTTGWQTPPTAQQIENAKNFKVTGWSRLWLGGNQGSAAQTAVQQALASGSPVAIGFPVFNDFMNLRTHSVYSTTSGTNLGGHMVAAFGYDAQGVFIRNSWGTGWGNGGDAKVSWSFVNSVVNGAYTVSGIQTPSAPIPMPPTVASLSVNKGSSDGGTQVTITGAGLASASAVRFGSASATFSPVQANGVTKLVATAPANALGTVDVTVTNTAGTSPVGTASKFTYVPPPPAVSGMSASSLLIFGGTTITVNGTNLTGAKSVKIGTKIATPKVLSATSLTFVAPPMPVGTYDVTVTTAQGTSPTGPAARLTYVNPPPPAVESVTPSSALTYLSTPVVVTGTNLTGASRVTLGGKALTFTRVSDTQLRLTVPPGTAGTVDLQVTTPGGTSEVGTSAQFTYRTPPAPAITSISPKSALTYVTTPVVITGVNLTAASKVTVDGVAVSFTRVSDTQIKVSMRPHAAGDVDVQVTTPGGVTATGSDAQFSYTAPPAPVVDTVSPASGLTYLTTTALVTGTDLTAASGVTAGGVKVTFSRISSTQLRVTLPPRAAGDVQLTVTTPGGTSTGTFTYVAPPPPKVTGLSVGKGLTYVSTPVTLTGTDLTAASAVTAGGTRVSFTRVSDTQIRATLPPRAAGSVDVLVTTPGGTSEAVPFTYEAPPPPVIDAISPEKAYTYKTTTVGLTGSNFTAASAVTLGGVKVSFVRISDTQLRVTLPPRPAGALGVRVTTPGGTSEAGTFTYETPPPPAISSLTVTSAMTYVSTVVLVNGSNFTAASRVTAGGVATPFTVVNDGQLRVVLPPRAASAAGTVDVQVTTPGGTTTASPASEFTFVAPPVPTLSSLSPASGLTTKSTTVVITGTGLTAASRVTVGGTAVTLVRLSDTQVRVTMPPRAAGTYPVVVTTPGGVTAASSGSTFRYTVS
ncbi:IPT/TIG domain-containing protein [Micromonospora pattaloongensis]|uniref:IPT/TIG domain-containing protein n=1 Tax=Micromonospora pattaloongensis TaxID=405436 RepID=A0A1H3HJG3_9ACTN|nr:IPT/TIG domain-containing protein [Micromonospora pattaloongensis]SDY15355.1 IPT/TIG domain-containing protein [Micromonospora pattaloongensis]